MAPTQSQHLLALLKEHFGFDAFRPLQREIVTDVLAGRDVFALLPTGGGKSLCFQLPAVAQEGLTLVVSPLIALMKDQVDSMTAMGIPATFLNSSITGAQARSRLDGLNRGQFKLLYAAPERLMQAQFLADLQAWKPRLIAIDEAHCISEWGHDFRPEYRQLARLRQFFPGVPLLALTATATDRVRADIVRQLELRDPGIYIASFNRPNLTYTVTEKSDPTTQALQFVKARAGESGIIYCHSRKSTESLAADLVANGISARAYHAGMESEDRARVQESFLRDETQVICATIAFGMGINKPNVRFVIHYDLPKNIEGYYQETGRAGRDSLPSDCVLFYSAGDVVKLLRFLDEKPEPERTVARQQLDHMMHFAESGECRRRAVLRYFSETFPGENCGACDNCLNPKVQFDGTVAAQKFLSCVYRVREKSGFGLGLAYYGDVLAGADTERIRRFGHETLSTYGIGKEHSRASWTAIGRELVRLGFLRQLPEKFNTVELTAEGRAALSHRTPVMLSTRPKAEKSRTVDDGAFDRTLFDLLRDWRKKLADERNVPAYIVLSDVSLRQIARDYPANLDNLGRINGIGRAKLHDFGDEILVIVAKFLRENQRQPFPSASAAPERPPRVSGARCRETARAFQNGESVEAIAQSRGLSERTIISHLVDAIAAGESVDVDRLVSREARQQIARAFDELGDALLAPIKEHLNDKFSYEKLQIARACYRSRQS